MKTAAPIDPFVAEALGGVREDWLAQVRVHARAAESRRHLAKYDTGTISEAACLYLRAVTSRLQPRVAIEIGTFIGSSSLAMQAGRIYTCDKSNDCGHLAKHIVCHPYTGSTRMFRQLVDRGASAEFFFFDGRIKDPDLPLIAALATPDTVYAFDDYEGREKGVINVEKLRPRLAADYDLILPPTELGIDGVSGTTTIALLVPRSRR